MKTVTLYCQYSTRPGAKKDYKKTSSYRRNSSSKSKIDEYTGSVEVSGNYSGVTAAVKTSWANSHSFSTSNETEYSESKESSIEYYDNITLLIRTLKYTYNIDGHILENTEEFIVQNVNKSYSTDELNNEAKKFMKEMFGINKTLVEIPLNLKKNILIIWKPVSRGDTLPENCIYAGNTSTDGHVYVGRFDNIPGKVNLKNNKINSFWVQAKGNRSCGEVLITNGNVKWVEIKRGDYIPDNAIYSGIDQSSDKVWVGRSISGEPGKINCHDNTAIKPKMYNLWCHHSGSSSKAHILVIE